MHVLMPCPPPSHISTAQYSFLRLYALTRTCFQTPNPSFLVHMASHMDRASLESTIKSIIVPSTNMGYLCSLKTLNFCTFSDIHQSHGLIQNFHTLTVCKHVFIADSLIQNLHTLTHKRFASMSSLHRAVFESVYVSVLCVCVNKFLLPFFVAC